MALSGAQWNIQRMEILVLQRGQVLEEGEALSKKQALLESNSKKLRAAAKEAATLKSALDESLAHEQATNASTLLQLEQANAALQVSHVQALLHAMGNMKLSCPS